MKSPEPWPSGIANVLRSLFDIISYLSAYGPLAWALLDRPLGAQGRWPKQEISCPVYYIHNNPVVRGLVAHPGDWPWSSWRFYYREDRSLLAMDHPR